VLTRTVDSEEDVYILGHCIAIVGVVKAADIERSCKVGDRCTVRARVNDGEITHVYSIARR
jgi:hypothetical protein